MSPPRGDPVSAVWPRRILLAGTFFGMLASHRFWLTSRRFPLGLPPLGEPRSYRSLARCVAGFAASPDEIQLVIVPRFGAVTVEDGGALASSTRR